MRTYGVNILLLLFAVALTACAGRPGPDLLLNTVTPVGAAQIVTVYAATTRARDERGIFTSGRGDQVSYIRFRISVPPGHRPGNIEWPKSKPDARTDFVTVEQQVLDREAFEREVSRGRGGKPPGVGVFVHGYNTNFTEAVYRIAQMAFDTGTEAVPILFSWPSEGTVAGYVADKDAATFSRDQLVGLLTMLAGKSTAGPVTVVGHSMGGWLTTEAVRQLRLSGKDAVIRRLHVVLAAPDIDVDVFTAQLAVIGPLTPPMSILVSSDDVALKVSEFLSTSRPRLGRIDVRDPRVEEATGKANIQIIDISTLETSDSLRHNRFVALAALYPRLATPVANGSPLALRRAGAFVFNAVGTTISSPFLIAGKIAAGE